MNTCAIKTEQIITLVNVTACKTWAKGTYIQTDGMYGTVLYITKRRRV